MKKVWSGILRLESFQYFFFKLENWLNVNVCVHLLYKLIFVFDENLSQTDTLWL